MVGRVAVMRLIYSCLVGPKAWKTREVFPTKLTKITPQNSDLSLPWNNSNLHALLWETVHKADDHMVGAGADYVHTGR